MLLQGVAGPQLIGDGAMGDLRVGRLGDLIVSELHGRFYEQTFRGNVYSGGAGLTAINNATFTTGTLGATCTPIIAIWNPSGSGVNAVVLQAIMAATITAATNTGGGPFVWATSTGNGAISTGSFGTNRSTLATGGGKCKVIPTNTALTGLTNNLVVQGASGLQGGSSANFSFVGTAAGQATTPGGMSVENLDGSYIVPPGGVLALLATTTPVAHSVATNIVWEEVQAA